MFKKIIFFLTVFTTSYLQAATRDISIEKFLELAMKIDPDYLKLKSQKENLNHYVDKNMPSNPFLLNLTSEKGYSSVEGSDTTEVRSELSKSVLRSGSKLSLSKSEITRPGRKENVTSVRLEQNLWKNSFGRDSRLRESSLGKLRTIEDMKILEQQEEYIVNILSSYLIYKKSKLNFELASQILSESKVTKKNVQRKYDLKIANRLDLDQSELLMLRRSEELIEIKKAFEDAKRRITTTIGMDIDNLNISNEADYFADLESKAQKLFEKQNMNSRDFIQSSLLVEQREEQSLLAQRDYGPDVKLVLGYNKDESQIFSAAIDQDETVVGFKVSIPLGDDNARAKIADAKIGSYQAQLEKRKLRDELKIQLDEKIETLKSLKQLIEVSERQKNLSQRIVKEEERKYQIGKLRLERLIEVKNDYATYRKNFQTKKYDYRIELVDFLALNDQLNLSR